ncbi:MAG TPA: cytochrome c maturation protein CcmE [Acidimicrobiia bacterium]|nr:cytochrome c maturation protein CcmE [Acidimicrobiia bacterium]
MTSTLEPTATTRPRFRARYFIVAGICLGAVAWLVLGPLAGNIVYFRTPTEALELRAKGDDGGRFRLMGEVVDGSVQEDEQTWEFDVTDGKETVHVVHAGDPPQLFGEGKPVVAEGRWDGKFFSSDQIMIRHDNEYKPPEVEHPEVD